jgi:TatD DNase family protein
LALLTDTHCHLYLDEFASDLDSTVSRALDAGVEKILVPGVDANTSRQAVELAARYPGLVFPAAGIHPNYASARDKDEIVRIKEILIENPDIAAIGEIGLDYYHEWSSRQDQTNIFKLMLQLADEFNLPVCLHVRDSAQEMIQVLDEWHISLVRHNHPLAQKPGVFHSYSGSDVLCKWGLEHGFMFGVSGMVTYPKSQALRDNLLKIGLDRLLSETDAPYLSPQPNRGKRNEPAFVKHTVEEIARLFNVPIEQAAEKLKYNAKLVLHWE